MFNFVTKDLPEGRYEPIPEGRYRLRIIDAEVRGNKAGNGEYLFIEWEVIGGEHEGRNFRSYFTTEHEKSPKAVEIGLSRIRRMLEALSMDALTDPMQLKNRDLDADVKINPPSDGYDASNDIRKFIVAPEGPTLNIAASRPAARSEPMDDNIPW